MKQFLMIVHYDVPEYDNRYFSYLLEKDRDAARFRFKENGYRTSAGTVMVSMTPGMERE